MTADKGNRQADQALERDLGAVRKAWNGLEQTNPPDLLDQVVLNLARREILGSGDAVRRKRSISWLGVFATASIVVLALTLTVEQRTQAPVPAVEKADGLRIDGDAAVMESDELRAKYRTGAVSPEKAAGQPRQERSAPPREAMQNLADAPAALESQAEPVPAAEDWVEKMLRLKHAGRVAELARELAAFRTAYPDYPLPPELAD